MLLNQLFYIVAVSKAINNKKMYLRRQLNI